MIIVSILNNKLCIVLVKNYCTKCFKAKCMVLGVLVFYENQQPCRTFPWRDISNVINHKKQFLIECQIPEDNVQLEFGDPESAKYVWKLCILQVIILR